MRTLVYLFVCLLLVACATPYQKQSLWNNVSGGYTDLALSKDTYLISMLGNQHTSPEETFKMLFYRAAEISQENEMLYFSVEDFQTDVKVRTAILPGWSSSNTSGTVFLNKQIGVGSYNGYEKSTYMPAQTIHMRDTIMRAVIKFVKKPSTKEKDSLGDVEFILNNWGVTKNKEGDD